MERNVFLVIVSFLALNSPNDVKADTSLPVVSCSSQYSIQQGQAECFTREGITANLPRISTSDTSQSKQSLLDSLTLDIDSLQKICSDLSRYQRASVCAVQVPQQCLPAEYNDYYPSAENVKIMLKSFCDNITVVDGECLKTVGDRLFDCGYQKGRSYKGSVNDVHLFCYIWAGGTECLREVMPTCGCPMTRLYVENSKIYLNVPGCSPINVKTPACQPGTNEFIDSAATMLHRMSLLVLTALVVCGLYNTM